MARPIAACALLIALSGGLLAVVLPAGLVLGEAAVSEPMQDLPEVHTHRWHNREHHVPDGGFQNVWPPYRGGSVWKGMTWFLGRAFTGKENRLPPVRPIARDSLLARPDSIHFTWIGHATILIQTPDRSILIDPMFSDRASPFTFAGPEREPELPLQINDLPEIDLVIISHDHYDHLDERTIQHLASARDPLFLTPLGTAKYLEGWGARRVVEMDWWQYVEVGSVRYHCLPAKHFSGRGLTNRDGTLWAGWYIQSLEGGTDVFYAGDTGYSPHFELIRERIGRPKVAILPIGAYLPAWLMQPIHVNPEEALDAFRDLQADHFLPVHWGTFDLADEPLHAPPDTLRRLAREHGLDERIHLLDIGETWVHPTDEAAANSADQF